MLPSFTRLSASIVEIYGAITRTNLYVGWKTNQRLKALLPLLIRCHERSSFRRAPKHARR